MSEFLPVRVIDSAPPIYAVKVDESRKGATLRSLCTPLDLARHAQAARIKRDPALSGALVIVLLDSPGGLQQTEVLLSWAIPIWLSGLNTTRLSEEKQALVLFMQQRAVELIEQAFARTENATSVPPAPSQPPAPQLIWQEWRALIDRTEAVYEQRYAVYEQRYQESLTEHQEIRNRLAKVEQQLRRELLPREQQVARPLPITAPEAGEVRSTMGSFAERLVQINLLASRARQKYGYPIAMTLAGLAEHFQVADVFDLPDKDWPAVLDWFTALLEE